MFFGSERDSIYFFATRHLCGNSITFWPKRLSIETLKKQILSLEKIGDGFKEKGDFPGRTLQEKAAYEGAGRICRKKADKLKVKYKIKTIHPDALEAIQEENSPETAFERYKDFVKKNFIEIAGLLITIGGVITSVALAMRNGTNRAGSTTQKAGNSVEKALGPIGSILGKIIQTTGKIILWFGDHLMIMIGCIVVLVFGAAKMITY